MSEHRMPDADVMYDALWHIKQWCDAYSVDVFPEPDLAAIRAKIGDAEMTKLHASWARHLLAGITRYARDGLAGKDAL